MYKRQPFIHGSWSHLASNTIPLLVLGFMMIYFYHHIAYRILMMIWLIDGCGVWLIGRESYHIGASGIVYGMASFLVFSGVLRRNRQLLAVALVVVFIYGGMIWGMFPYVTDVSWEAHLVGFAAGVYFAYHYRNQGPPHDHVPEWMSEDITDQEEEDKASNAGENSINYIYIPKKDSHDDPLS